MIHMQNNSEEITVSFPKNLMTSQFVKEFLERLETETILQQSRLTEENAWMLSEDLKENWWKESKETILKRV